MEIVAKAKKWGSSLGVVIPKKAVEKLGLKEGGDVVLSLTTPGKSDILRRIWGKSKGDKKTAQEWKDEFRRTLYSEH
ncbi:AbrB/MazE/SpoVT family DNA-binding domain-containing protein [Candidatus Woesearchaeota archaeon]|nr:AbrB/MazE/SpoVT family DNA-binding domain-containing protein [Candidatus Woesearchaeota archaeon]